MRLVNWSACALPSGNLHAPPPCRPAIIQLHHHRWWHVADGSNAIEEGVFYYTPAEAQLLVFAQVGSRVARA